MLLAQFERREREWCVYGQAVSESNGVTAFYIKLELNWEWKANMT